MTEAGFRQLQRFSQHRFSQYGKLLAYLSRVDDVCSICSSNPQEMAVVNLPEQIHLLLEVIDGQMIET